MKPGDLVKYRPGQRANDGVALWSTHKLTDNGGDDWVIANETVGVVITLRVIGHGESEKQVALLLIGKHLGWQNTRGFDVIRRA